MYGINVKPLLLFTVISTLSEALMAHAGHDHGHWLSPAIHSILFVSVAAVAALFLALSVYRKRSKHQNKKGDQ